MGGKENLILTASPMDARTAARRAVQTAMFILSRSRKNEPRKRTKGPNALWLPATRKRRFALASLMFARRGASSAFASVF